MCDAAQRHDALVARLRESDAASERVLDAFAAVPRHVFLPASRPSVAYTDDAIVTHDEGGVPTSSSSQPSLMARMLEQLDVRRGDRVLEVGAGTGYNAALLAALGAAVTTVELQPEVAAAAREHCARRASRRRARTARARRRPGSVLVVTRRRRRAAGGPYDRIIVTAGCWSLPALSSDALADGGVLVAPLRVNAVELVVGLRRDGEVLRGGGGIPCGFMPLRGGDERPWRWELGGGGIATADADLGVEGRGALDRLLATPGREVDDPLALRSEHALGALLWLGLQGDPLISLVLPGRRRPPWTVGLDVLPASLLLFEFAAGYAASPSARLHGGEPRPADVPAGMAAWRAAGSPGPAALELTVEPHRDRPAGACRSRRPTVRRRWSAARTAGRCATPRLSQRAAQRQRERGERAGEQHEAAGVMPPGRPAASSARPAGASRRPRAAASRSRRGRACAAARSRGTSRASVVTWSWRRRERRRRGRAARRRRRATRRRGPRPRKKTPNALSTMPTAYLRCDSGSRASGRCSDEPIAITATTATAAPASAGAEPAAPAPSAATISTTSSPSSSTPLPATIRAAQSGLPGRRRRARAAPRAPRGTRPARTDGARGRRAQHPLRSHSSPNSSSATPITTWSGSSGIRASTTGPTTTPASASSTTAPGGADQRVAPAPRSAPTASTIASASSSSSPTASAAPASVSRNAVTEPLLAPVRGVRVAVVVRRSAHSRRARTSAARAAAWRPCRAARPRSRGRARASSSAASSSRPRPRPRASGHDVHALDLARRASSSRLTPPPATAPPVLARARRSRRRAATARPGCALEPAGRPGS